MCRRCCRCFCRRYTFNAHDNERCPVAKFSCLLCSFETVGAGSLESFFDHVAEHEPFTKNKCGHVDCECCGDVQEMQVTSGTDEDEEMAVDSLSDVSKPETCEIGVGASPEEIMSVNMSPQASGIQNGKIHG